MSHEPNYMTQTGRMHTTVHNHTQVATSHTDVHTLEYLLQPTSIEVEVGDETYDTELAGGGGGGTGELWDGTGGRGDKRSYSVHGRHPTAHVHLHGSIVIC